MNNTRRFSSHKKGRPLKNRWIFVERAALPQEPYSKYGEWGGRAPVKRKDAILQRSQGGYALLISVVVISTVLLMLATISARRVQDGFFSSLGLQEMTKAQALVEGCAQEVLYRRSINSQYGGNETLQLVNGTCLIRPIVGQVVEIEAQSQERYYRVRFTLTADEPPRVGLWERVESF